MCLQVFFQVRPKGGGPLPWPTDDGGCCDALQDNGGVQYVAPDVRRDKIRGDGHARSGAKTAGEVFPFVSFLPGTLCLGWFFTTRLLQKKIAVFAYMLCECTSIDLYIYIYDIYMYVRIHIIHMNICMYVRTYVCLHEYIYMYILVCACMYACADSRICAYTHMCTHLWI